MASIGALHTDLAPRTGHPSSAPKAGRFGALANLKMRTTEMVSDLYATLAHLRGYLLTGNPQAKADRAALWKEFDAAQAEFDKMAAQFNPADARIWGDTKKLL